jgi:hypothetical protein
MSQQVIPIDARFFNDGAWYVLSSTSLGGSQFSPEQMVNKLQGEMDDIRQLLTTGVCLPLFFPGDCALDKAIIVIGDLTEQQEREWLGRIQSKLHIPCGEFVLLGGGGSEENWEAVLNHFSPPNPHFMNFQKVRLAPGDYLVEVYAFLGSMNFNFELDDIGAKNWQRWLKLDEIDESKHPAWFKFLLENDYIDSEQFGLQEYIIRLSPLQESPPLPELDEELYWCSLYQYRQPQQCPKGILRSQLLKQS